MEIGLLPTQKKQLWDKITNVIGHAQGFSLNIKTEEIIISHIDGYYFKLFDILIGSTVISYRIGYFPYLGFNALESSKHKPYSDVIISFERWLKNIKLEITCEDVWGRTNDTKYFSSFKIGSDSSEKFTEEEQCFLKEEIEKLKQELSEREDLKKSLTQINIKLDVLGELVSEFSKVDWRNHVIGSMMGLVIDEFATNDEVKSIASKLMSFVSGAVNKLIE